MTTGVAAQPRPTVDIVAGVLRKMDLADRERERIHAAAVLRSAQRAHMLEEHIIAAAADELAAQGVLDAHWRVRAHCATSDPDLFYPEATGRANDIEQRRAKELCAPCPVRLSCLGEALRADEPHGIWGGMSAPERRRLAARL